MSAEPLTEGDLAWLESLTKSDDEEGMTRRLLATIRARDEEIARLREERDAAKASALAPHHIAFPQA